MKKLMIALVLLAAASARADAIFFPEVRAVDVPAVTRLADWDTTPFVPAGTQTFFSLETRANTRDTNIFIVWGVDPTANRILFRIALVGSGELVTFSTRLRLEQIRAAASADPTQAIKWGDMGQITLPPPPPPPDGPGGDGWLASRVMRFAKITMQVQAQFNAPGASLVGGQ